ncbi:MAG: hypothetical protein ACREX3_23875, partial [Gammaproteobacteria bacterium]
CARVACEARWCLTLLVVIRRVGAVLAERTQRLAGRSRCVAMGGRHALPGTRNPASDRGMNVLPSSMGAW